jgi:hypothetical protein
MIWVVEVMESMAVVANSWCSMLMVVAHPWRLVLMAVVANSWCSMLMVVAHPWRLVLSPVT